MRVEPDRNEGSASNALLPVGKIRITIAVEQAVVSVW